MMYSELANSAIAQEHKRNYGTAAQYWIAANKAARKTENRQWAANRALFCNRRHATGARVW